jgi:hypothetical protein
MGCLKLFEVVEKVEAGAVFSMVGAWQWTAKIPNGEDLSWSGE